ncbi:MAG: hypothetical protein JRI25_24385, partial [Deltaproteobacteria bacterium]|nr:hypothetical protein [Deltaproteobacteria bacterium]
DHAPLFPLPHRGIATCTECHLTEDYAAFSCTHCHEHRQSEADDEHDEVSGYQYDSEACFDCHPDGRE